MTVQEMELPSQGSHKYRIKLYRNQMELRNREELKHSHLALEINQFNESCRGIYGIGNKEYVIEPGDIFFLRSHEQHSILQMEPTSASVCTGLRFSPDFIWSPNNELCDMKQVHHVFLTESAGFEHRLKPDEETTKKIRILFQEIVEEFKQEKTEYSLMVKVKLISMLVLLTRNYDDMAMNTRERQIKRENRERIEQVMRYMDLHLGDSLTLQQLAGIAAMSSSHFSQLFKTLNGFTVWEYLVEKRIELAQVMLVSTGEPILEIALQCGFNNAANFNRAFKRMTGVTPREFRNTPT